MTVRNIKTREGYDFWDKLCAIPRYGFIHSPDNSRVLKAEGLGNWIDMHAAQEVVDAAQDEVNGLRAEVEALRAAITPAVIDWVRCGLSVNGRLEDGTHPALEKLRAAMAAKEGV